MANGKFTKETKRIIKQRVGGLCSNPKCRKRTEADTTIGQAAHICGRAKKTARYDEQMSDDERASYENGIWLCSNCHKPADHNSLSNRVTKDELKRWKSEAECRALREQGTADLIDERLSDIALSILRKSIAKAEPILKVVNLGERYIQVGDEQLGAETNRDFAKYTAAIEELERADFIHDPRGLGRYFDVTNKGYSFVEDSETA